MAKTLDQGASAFIANNRAPSGIPAFAGVAFGILDRNYEQACHALDGIFVVPVIAAAVAATGTLATDAAQLGAGNVLVVSSAAATAGVKLPTGTAGAVLHVINNSATAFKLYPATGGTISGLAVNVFVTCPAAAGIRLLCTAPDTWVAFVLPAKLAA